MSAELIKSCSMDNKRSLSCSYDEIENKLWILVTFTSYTAVPNTVAAKYIISYIPKLVLHLSSETTQHFQLTTYTSWEQLTQLSVRFLTNIWYSFHFTFSHRVYIFLSVYIYYSCFHLFFSEMGLCSVFRYYYFYSYYILCLYVVDSQWVQSIYEVAFAYCFLQTSRIIGVYT